MLITTVFFVATVTLRSPSVIPPLVALTASLAGAHSVPLHFRTCPVLGIIVLLTSPKSLKSKALMLLALTLPGIHLLFTLSQINASPALGAAVTVSTSLRSFIALAPPPPPLTVAKLKLPAPSVVKNCPLVPSDIPKSVKSVGEHLEVYM